MRIVILVSCLWLACSGHLAQLQAQFQTEHFAAEEAGKTCKEALANMKAVEDRWAPVWAKEGVPAPRPSITLVCGGP